MLPAMRKSKNTYTITEAARIIGVSRAGVYEAIKVGRLKAKPRKVTRILWQIDAESVRRFKVSLSHKARGQKAHRKTSK